MFTEHLFGYLPPFNIPPHAHIIAEPQRDPSTFDMPGISTAGLGMTSQVVNERLGALPSSYRG